MSTLEELSDILDAIFRQRVSLVAAEAFIDYWNMSYSRMPVPKQGWPLAIQHCLSSVGLLPQEVEKESILEPAFAATVAVPHTPPATSFTTSILRPKAFTMIQSPPRPQKMFVPFPIIPSSPVSPLVRRSSDLARRRMPLSSIQLCESPSKRRRLAVDHDDGSDEKENVVVSVVDRIAGMSPGEAKKRKREEVEHEVEEQKSNSPAKKLKSTMRPRTSSASKKTRQHASPAFSVASNESEDERRWVEATLTHKIPFPVTEAQDDTCGEFSTPVLPRRVNNLAYVLVPSKKRPKEREHATSSGVENLSSSSTTMGLKKMLSMKKLIRRSASIPESMLSKKRKRQESDIGEDSLDLYDLIGSDPLPALHLSLPPPLRQLRRAYSLPSSDSDASSTSRSSSSDDDPYIGQVTPHHLISPGILQRRVKTSETRKMSQFGDPTMMPGSDDSMTSSESEQESPTKGVFLRQMNLKARMNVGLEL